jgi:hypothetical protein
VKRITIRHGMTVSQLAEEVGCTAQEVVAAAKEWEVELTTDSVITVREEAQKIARSLKAGRKPKLFVEFEGFPSPEMDLTDLITEMGLDAPNPLRDRTIRQRDSE